MIKINLLFILFLLISCSELATKRFSKNDMTATDSIALGRISASAIKRIHNQEVCFDIELKCKDVKLEQVQASNWNLAWVDNTDHYHLMPTTQRLPGSIPKSKKIGNGFDKHNEFYNSFTNCIPAASIKDVKGIVMTARELPFDRKNELRLNWSQK